MQIADIYKQLSTFDFISVFYRTGNSYLSRKYEFCGLGYGQHQFLSALYKEDGISQDELTKRIAVDKATTARAVSKLKEAGFVAVKVDDLDKRVHRIFLTEKALEFKPQFLEIATEWEDYLLNKLTPSEKESLLKLFYKIVQEKN